MSDEIKIDKLDEKVEIRVPSILKNHLSTLSADQKKLLNLELLKTMAGAVHQSRLNYSDYLSSESNSTL